MRRASFFASGLALTIALAGSAHQTRPSGPPPGRLLDIGGRSLHIRCAGPASGGPTVILEAGAGDDSSRWTAVQDRLAPRIRSCAYDRAGLGWSAGTQLSMGENAANLHALLAAAKVDGPYVLAGHSMGALIVRRYARDHPDQVVGMVLAEPAHENARLFFTGDNQWKRVREQPIPIGADFQETYVARQANPVPLGDRPLIVLEGTRPDPKVSLPDDIAREKDAQVKDLLRLSRNSKLVLDESSGHQIHVDNPDLVASAIQEVVTAATKGTREAVPDGG